MRINIVLKKKELHIVNLCFLRCSCDMLVSNNAHSSILGLLGYLVNKTNRSTEFQFYWY